MFCGTNIRYHSCLLGLLNWKFLYKSVARYSIPAGFVKRVRLFFTSESTNKPSADTISVFGKLFGKFDELFTNTLLSNSFIYNNSGNQEHLIILI